MTHGSTSANRRNWHAPIKSVIGTTDFCRCRRCFRTLPWDQFEQIVKRTFFKGNKAAMLLHPYCSRCRKQMKSEWTSHELYSPKMHRRIEDLVNRARNSSRTRGLIHLLDIDDMVGMFIEQKGLCALTGFQMSLSRVEEECDMSASLDRIDSAGHYVANNVQFVCRRANVMKMDMDQASFIRWCRAIGNTAVEKDADSGRFASEES